MEWINVKDALPKPFEVVWIYWRSREVLLGCRTYTEDEADNSPEEEGWYSFEDEKCRNNHWWVSVAEAGLDAPDAPKACIQTVDKAHQSVDNEGVAK